MLPVGTATRARLDQTENRIQQSIIVEGLMQDGICYDSESLPGESGYDHCRNLAQFRFFPQVLQQVPASDLRQHEVNQHHAWPQASFELTNRLCSVGRGDDRQTLQFEEGHDSIPGVGVIFNEEDRTAPTRHGMLWSSAKPCGVNTKPDNAKGWRPAEPGSLRALAPEPFAFAL